MFDEAIIREFAAGMTSGVGEPAVSISALHGGLESRGIARVSLDCGCKQACFAVKRLPEGNPRELKVYRALKAATSVPVAPELLGSRACPDGDVCLFLEWAPNLKAWPWKEERYVRQTLRTLALVHNLDQDGFHEALSDWDYDSELRDSVIATIDAYGDALAAGVRPGARPMTRPLERLGSSLTAIRAQVAAFSGRAVLHGDLHSGNAVIRGDERAVLLDWGRARFGSPLEDLASWLQSLGFWEYEALRRHDRFVRDYLEFAGKSGVATRAMRDAYWLAAACNAFAGALRYHLLVARDRERTKRRRAVSLRAATDWLRILRRADACWRA